MSANKILIALAAAAAVLSGAPAFAHGDRWDHHHPRQAEVLHREHHQIARINQERREGAITGAQARAMRASDRAIARQDRADARANGGYITKGQQRDLNHQLNAQSQAIGH